MSVFRVNISLGLKVLFLRRHSFTEVLMVLASIFCIISPVNYKLGFPVQVALKYWLITK